MDSPIAEGLPGGDDDYYDNIDESLVESFIIIGLMATLAFLVYYRNQRALGHRRELEGAQNAGGDAGGAVAATNEAGAPLSESSGLGVDPTGTESQGQQQQQQQQQADGGFFPPPDDPNYGTWVAGGVGH